MADKTQGYYSFGTRVASSFVAFGNDFFRQATKDMNRDGINDMHDTISAEAVDRWHAARRKEVEQVVKANTSKS